MTHTTAILNSAVITFQYPTGFAGEHITRPKIQNTRQILKFMRKVMDVHAQIPVSLRAAVGLQVIANCACKVQPLVPRPTYNGNIQTELTLPYIHDRVRVPVCVNTYSGSLNIKSTWGVHVQAFLVCFAFRAFSVLSVQMLHKPGNRVIITSLRQNLRAGRRNCCRRCSPILCHN